MSRTLSEASSYTAHLQSLGALVEVYTNYQRDNVAVPETLIQRIQEKLEQLVLPSIERNMTDYEAASDELLDLEIIADDLGCHHKNKAEDNACQFVVLHDCIEHRIEDMKRLDGLKGMSYDEVEQKWKRHCEEAWEMAAWDEQHTQLFPGF